jgi:class 3 adenylate cyclase/CHASE2 domain-containing sensor protein
MEKLKTDQTVFEFSAFKSIESHVPTGGDLRSLILFTAHAILPFAEFSWPKRPIFSTVTSVSARIPRAFQLRGYRWQRLFWSMVAGLVTAVLGFGLIFNILVADLERTLGLNWLFQHRAKRESPPDIAVVAISADTEEALGLPVEVDECRLREWPRAVHAILINRLTEKKAEGIVYDVYFQNPKPDDATLTNAITQADRVLLYAWMKQPKESGAEEERPLPPTKDLAKEAGAEEERPSPPTKDLAEKAKAFGPFLLPATEPKHFRFWAFLPTTADPTGAKTPMLPAIALQLKALPFHAVWLGVLKDAGVAVNDLPTQEHILQLMEKLRRMFRNHTPRLQAKVEQVLAANPQRLNTETQALLRALAALYGGPSDYYLNFYGKYGKSPTVRTIPYESLLGYQVEYQRKTGAQFQQNETLTFAEGTARLSELVDDLDTGQHLLKFRLLGGSPPVPNSVITGGTSHSSVVAMSKAVPLDTELLTNSMVFVGCSDAKHAEGPDRVLTSFTTGGIDLRGVEVMATAYANLVSERTLQPPDTSFSKLVVLAFGLTVGILVFLSPWVIAVPGVVVLTLLYALALKWCFSETDLWLPLAIPVLVQLPAALLIGLTGKFLLERHQKGQLKQAIGHYLPEDIVHALSERQVDPTTLNRVGFGTCLATDMSNFSALTEESKLPDKVAEFMNKHYYDPIAKALKRHGADVREFRADMIMCAWISPKRSALMSRKAVEAAIEVKELITRFAQQHGSRHFSPRIGLHDGDIYAGHTGGGGHFLYSIVGDAANTAARLESLNKHLGTNVLAAQSVVQDSDEFLVRPLGLFRLKGKTDPTFVCEILGKKEDAKREHLDLCTRFAEGLAAFQRKEWLGAASLFEAINKSFRDDGPSKFYWVCCQKYARNPSLNDRPVIIQMDDK